jgi:hypothetical protein
MAMTARSGKFKTDLSVALTVEIQAALETACAFSQIKPSQYCRIALVEKLAREKFLEHPGVTFLNNRQQPEIKPAA